METQRQAVQMGEDIGRQPPRRLLADLLEHDIAHIVEQHLPEARDAVSRDQREQHRQLGAQRIVGHAVNHCLVKKRHGENGCLGAQDQKSGDDDSHPQTRLVLGPEIGEKALERRDHRRIDLTLGGIIRWHGCGCRDSGGESLCSCRFSRPVPQKLPLTDSL